MICDSFNENTYGTTEIPIEPLIYNALSFINRFLPLFPDALIRSGMKPKEESEKILNQQLVDFFNGHSSDFNQYLLYRFIFRKDDENKGTNYKPDIGITIWHKKQSNSESQSFFQIECKRLPIPNISKSRSEKEYVIGLEKNTGGIERFKNNKHGDHINEAAIIAFIQQKPIEEWYKKITTWIQYEIDNINSTWTTEDHLEESFKDVLLHKYISMCHRKGNNPIKLHHYLLDISS